MMSKAALLADSLTEEEHLCAVAAFTGSAPSIQEGEAETVVWREYFTDRV